MATANTSAPTFTLEEEGGTYLELRERALPYRPLTISGKQRAEFTWYPGNPEATVQMLGPDEGAIQLRGYWKDRFIQGTQAATIASAEQLSFGRQGGFSVGQGVASISDLVSTVDAMRRRGRRIKLTWGDLVRVGHITGFTQTWHNVHDCEWEIDFSVVSQGEGPVVSVAASGVTAADTYQQELAYLDTLDAARDAQKITPTVTFLQKVQAAYALFEEAQFQVVSAMYGIATNISQYAAAPGDMARRSTALYSGIVTQASAFLGGTVDRALSDWFEFTYWGSEDQTPYGVQLNSANTRRSVRDAVQAIRYNNAISRYELQQQLNAELVVSYVAPGNIDLRDISTRYYGTQNEWRFLMEFNGLRSSEVPAGTLILVPRKPSGASAGNPPARGS